MFKNFIPKTHLLKTPTLASNLKRSFVVVSKSHPDTGPSQVNTTILIFLKL